MKRLLLAAVLAVLPVLQAFPAFALTTCGADECALVDDFTSDTSGWTPAEPGTVASWQASQSFTTTCGWWEFWCTGTSSSADGVMAVYMNPPMVMIEMPAAKLQKWIDLTPGTYKVVARVSQDPLSAVNASRAPEMSVSATFNNTTYQVSQDGVGGNGSGWVASNRQFKVWESSTFVVDRNISAMLEADFSYTPIEHTAYVDYIYVVQVSAIYPTANPALPTLPAQATPPPMPTEYCRPPSSQTTPTPSAFSLTPTPAPAARFYDFQSFNTGTGNWGASGGVSWVASPNHGNTPELGAAQIAYSSNGLALDARPSLAFGFSPAITAPVYLNGFVYLNAPLNSGVAAYLEVWRMDGTDTWVHVQDHQLGYGSWRPFHSEILTGTVRALALVARRSDGSTTATVTVDDLAVYTRLSDMPVCSSWNNADGKDENTVYGNPSLGFYTLNVANNHDCPPTLKVPNNFFGMVLGGLTVWLDNLYADSPNYELGVMPAAVKMFMAPFSIALILLLAFIRLDVLWQVAGVRITASVFLLGRALWQFVVRTIKA
jgi:hypothetical protein